MNLINICKAKWNMNVDPVFGKLRKMFLNNTDFTIICNNCWGGYIYRHFGIPYLSPTVGLYFFAEDYVKFCTNLHYYLSLNLHFISAHESRHYDELIKRKNENAIIGVLDDIEVVFLHYSSQQEAYEKWNRRRERVNYDNLIFKFSKMNCCTEKELALFDAFEARKKFAFVPEQDNNLYRCGINTKLKGTEILNDTLWFEKFIDIRRMINCSRVEGDNYFD